MFVIRYSKQALKIKVKMPRDIAKRIDAEIESIAVGPAKYEGDWKPLQGSPFWRLRIGGWRVICEIVKNKLIIYVLKIGSRGDIYK
ncbi:MAG: type II toxin-antitoxin system RelE family toxin [Smithella sp.]